MASRLDMAMRTAWLPRSGQRGGDLPQLPGVVQIVEAHEEEGLAPVQRPEHGMLHRLPEAAGRIGGERPREEDLAVGGEDPLPLRGGADGRARGILARRARGGGAAVQDSQDAAAEVAP